MCIVRDNTIEENLRIDILNQKKFIDDITKKSPFFIYVYDSLSEHLIFSNKKLSEVYDIDSDDADSLKIISQIIHPDDIEGFVNYRNEHISINDNEPRSH